jgi:hypothetical protein
MPCVMREKSCPRQARACQYLIITTDRFEIGRRKGRTQGTFTWLRVDLSSLWKISEFSVTVRSVRSFVRARNCRPNNRHSSSASASLGAPRYFTSQSSRRYFFRLNRRKILFPRSALLHLWTDHRPRVDRVAELASHVVVVVIFVVQEERGWVRPSGPCLLCNFFLYVVAKRTAARRRVVCRASIERSTAGGKTGCGRSWPAEKRAETRGGGGASGSLAAGCWPGP